MNIHKYANSNHGLIIRTEEDHPWHSLGDCDEFLDSSISVEKGDREFRNMDTDWVSNNNGFRGDLTSALADVGNYSTDVARNARKNWDLTLTMMKSTHGDDLLPVDYDQAAFEIWEARWKPLYQQQIKWLEERLADKDFKAIQEDYLEHIANNITYSNFDLFSGLEVNIDEIWDETTDENCERIVTIWLNHLKNQISTEKQNFTVDTLDMFIEFQHEMDMNSELWNTITPDGDGVSDIMSLVQETIVDLYVNKNPNVWVGQIEEGRHEWRLHANTQEGLTWNFSEMDEDHNTFIIAKNNEVALSVANGVNQFLNGDWYWAELIYIIPDEDLHLYEDYETEDGLNYIRMEDSCGGFESEDGAIEYFNYLDKEPKLKPTISYSTLGNVQVQKVK